MKPALALKAAEVQDPEDHQGAVDQGMAEERRVEDGRAEDGRAEDDAFS